MPPRTLGVVGCSDRPGGMLARRPVGAVSCAGEPQRRDRACVRGPRPSPRDRGRRPAATVRRRRGTGRRSRRSVRKVTGLVRPVRERARRRRAGFSDGAAQVFGQQRGRPGIASARHAARSPAGRALHHEAGSFGDASAGNVADVCGPAHPRQAQIVESPPCQALDDRHGDSSPASPGSDPEPDHRALLRGALLEVERTEQLAASRIDAGESGVAGLPEVRAGPDEPVGASCAGMATERWSTAGSASS